MGEGDPPAEANFTRMNLRVVRTLRELDRKLDELHAADAAAEEAACFELARSASHFTRQTQKVVDDTVSLSATLMRAGEVGEANRLLEEAEIKVRTEEAALLETVNEVRAAGQLRKRRMTRLRLAKTFATAVLSGSMFAFSVFGVALARLALQPEEATEPVNTGSASSEARERSLHEVVVAPGVKLQLTSTEVKKLSRLTTSGDTEGLEAFLAVRLPAALLERVQEALTLSSGLVLERLSEEAEFERVAASTYREKSEASPEPEESPSEGPSEPEGSPSPQEQDEPEPSPGPSEQPPDDDTPLEGLPLPFNDGG